MRIVLAGNYADRMRFLFAHYNERNQIVGFIPSNETDLKFYDFSIIKANGIRYFKDLIVIVAGSFEDYCVYKNNLIEEGLSEFDDFIWGELYKKKMVLINANCHGQALIKYLELSENFNTYYTVYPIPAIPINTAISSILLEHTSVYIHQDIRRDNSVSYEISDEYTCKWLSAECNNIIIPNLVGTGDFIFPNLGELIKDEGKTTDLIFRDYILDDAYKSLGENSSIEAYIDYFDSFSYTAEYLNELYHRFLEKIREREKNWTIKISDFIKNNNDKVPLWVDKGHPSKYLMEEIGRQVLLSLGLSCDVQEAKYESYLGRPAPVCSAVKKCFHMNFICDLEPIKSFFFPYEIVDEKEYKKRYIKEYLMIMYGIWMND